MWWWIAVLPDRPVVLFTPIRHGIHRGCGAGVSTPPIRSPGAVVTALLVLCGWLARAAWARRQVPTALSRAVTRRGYPKRGPTAGVGPGRLTRLRAMRGVAGRVHHIANDVDDPAMTAIDERLDAFIGDILRPYKSCA